MRTEHSSFTVLGAETLVTDAANYYLMTREADGAPTTPDALCQRAATYASTVDLPTALPTKDITWAVSHQAKRWAGRIKVSVQNETTIVNPHITLAWTAHEAFGWEETKATIRHELIHLYEYCEYGMSAHGPRFKRLAAELNCGVTCNQFVEPRYQLVCPTCESVVKTSYTRSKAIKAPELYSCSTCQSPVGPLYGYDTKSDTQWTTWREFAHHYDDADSLANPYRYAVVCECCECILLKRHRRSKYVSYPERYRCPECGPEDGKLIVYDHRTGRQWRSNTKQTAETGASDD